MRNKLDPIKQKDIDMYTITQTIKRFLASRATIAMMATTTGCATIDEPTNEEDKIKIVLSQDFDANNTASSFERVCFNNALKTVREAEAEKYNSDKVKQAQALKCFDACGGAYLKIADECRFMPSKYDFDTKACFCNGQKIIPHKEQKTVEAELKACQQICEYSNTTDKHYAVDTEKTHPFGECVCKIVEEQKQR